MEISPEEEEKFQSLISAMKESVDAGDIKRAIEMSERALQIRDSEKLRRRLAKMKAYQREIEEGEEGDDVADVGNGFYIAQTIEKQLYPYQKDGLRWLWDLFKKQKGGILADDMGLGKTFQVIAFLVGLLDQQKIQNALIIMPVTLMSNWEKEFQKWIPSMTVEIYHGNTRSARDRILYRIQRAGGVMLTSYGLIVTSWDALSSYHGRPFVWDYVILDEGHKIKNPTKLTKSIHNIPARNRIVLTGTPVQNNLSEMWSLFNFVHHGSLLGSAKTFKIEFETPIIRGRKKDASAAERKLGEEMSNILRKRIEPYFLRRTKAEVFKEINSNEASLDIGKKNDFTVWICLSSTQLRLYKDFLQTDRVREILMTKHSPLLQLAILKKICDHPRLLSAAACEELGLQGQYSGTNYGEVQFSHLSDEELIEESGKLKFLICLLIELHFTKHRTVVFSQSLVILNIITRILLQRGFKVMRVDGSTEVRERLNRINTFEKDKSYGFFLLTSQVGGVGLTITSADRVVIYDPSWNPATDAQAVDRVYRIGQRKHVIVYRLITCGTVEEKIYRRQVFKHSIHKQTVEADENPCRYFSNQELREMFILDDPTMSKTQMQLEKMHSANRQTTVDVDKHIAFLYSLEIFGISDHDLLFSVQQSDTEKLADVDQRFIGDHVNRANKLVNMECELADTARLELGNYVTPFSVDLTTPIKQPLSSRSAPDVDSLSKDLKKMSPFKVKLKKKITSVSNVELAYSDANDSLKRSDTMLSYVKECLGSNVDMVNTSEGSDNMSQQSIESVQHFSSEEVKHDDSSASNEEVICFESSPFKVQLKKKINSLSNVELVCSDVNDTLRRSQTMLSSVKEPCSTNVNVVNTSEGSDNMSQQSIESAQHLSSEEVKHDESSASSDKVEKVADHSVSYMNVSVTSPEPIKAEERSSCEQPTLENSSPKNGCSAERTSLSVSVNVCNGDKVPYKVEESMSPEKETDSSGSLVETSLLLTSDTSMVSSHATSFVIVNETLDNSVGGETRNSDASVVPDSEDEDETSNTEPPNENAQCILNDYNPEVSPATKSQFLNSTTLSSSARKIGDAKDNLVFGNHMELMDVSRISHASPENTVHHRSVSSSEADDDDDDDDDDILPEFVKDFTVKQSNVNGITTSELNPSSRESRLSASRLRRSSMFLNIMKSLDDIDDQESEEFTEAGSDDNNITEYYDVDDGSSESTSSDDSNSENDSSYNPIRTKRRKPRVLTSSDDDD